MEEKKKPYSFWVGRLEVTIWDNPSKNNGVWFNTEIVRKYKDSDGAHQESTSYGFGDLLDLAKAADMAFDWIHKQEMEARLSKAKQ